MNDAVTVTNTPYPTSVPNGTTGVITKVDGGLRFVLFDHEPFGLWLRTDEIEAIPTNPVPEFSSDEWYTIMQALCLMEISEAFTIGPDLADRIGAYLDGLTDDE